MKLPSAPTTALFTALSRTASNKTCMTWSTIQATFNARIGRNMITDSMYSIWAATGEGTCASAGIRV